jgi:hypothetical protein
VAEFGALDTAVRDGLCPELNQSRHLAITPK